MSQNKDDKSAASRPATDGGLPKRPVPTIDLKATEIKADAKAPASAASGPASGFGATTGPGFKTGSGSSTGLAQVSSAATPAGKVADAKPAEPKAADGKPAMTSSATGSIVPNIDTKTSGKPGSDAKKTETPKPQSAANPGGGSKPATATPSTTSASGRPPSVPPPAARSGSGFVGRTLSYASAAVLGGLLAIFGADFVAGTLGLDVRPGIPSTSAVDELTTRLAKLERTGSATGQAAGTPALQTLTEQLTQANDRIAKLEAGNQQTATHVGNFHVALAGVAETTRKLEERVNQGAGQPASAEVTGRVAKLEDMIQGLSTLAQAEPGRPLPEMARLSSKLNELETAMAALRKTGHTDTMAPIEARLAEARKAEAQMSESVAQLKAESTKRLRELEAIKTQTERLEQRVDGVKSDAGTARSHVDALKTDVTAQLQTVARQGDLKASLDVVDKRVAGIEGRIDVMAKRDDERQANAERIVVSLQLANLKRAMEQGKPYAEALAEVEKSAGGLLDVAPLRGNREKGVPNATELAALFKPMARSVLEAEQDKSQASTVERMLQSAKSVVQIRRVGGGVQGDTPEALLARAEHALKTGDLETTAKEMKSLKPELRVVAQAWLDQHEARVTVDRAMKAIEDKLKTAIAGAPANAAAAAPTGARGGKQ